MSVWEGEVECGKPSRPAREQPSAVRVLASGLRMFVSSRESWKFGGWDIVRKQAGFRPAVVHDY